MNIDLTALTRSQLVDLYNRHNPGTPVKSLGTRVQAEAACHALLGGLEVKPPRPMSEMRQSRPGLKATLQLADRTLLCVETGETWKNAYRMWQAHPDWMSSGQVDRMTAKLYSAAKSGVGLRVMINGRTFALKHMFEGGTV